MRRVARTLVGAAMVVGTLVAVPQTPPASAGLDPGSPLIVDAATIVSQYELAYNPERNEYLGVYRRATGTSDTSVMIVRIAADGALLSGPTVVAPNQPYPHDLITQTGFWTPRVTYNAATDQYLVVVLRQDGVNPNSAVTGDRQSVVYGRLVSDLGVPVGGEAQLSPDVGDTYFCLTREPDVVADPNTGGYLLAFDRWYATSPGFNCGGLSPQEWTNVLMPLSGALTQGAPVDVSGTSLAPLQPRLAHNPVTNQFMLTQKDADRAGTARIFTPALGQVASIDIANFAANSEPGSGGINGSVPAADPVTGNWLVASSTDFGPVVSTNLISPTGALLGAPLTSTLQGIPSDLVAQGDGTWVIGTGWGLVAQLWAPGTLRSQKALFQGGTGGQSRYPGVATNRSSTDPQIMTLGANIVDSKPTVIPVLPFVDLLIPVVPARVLESRTGPNDTTVDGLFEGIGQRGADSTLELTVAGRGGVPGDAEAAYLNVTAVSPVAAGYLTVFPCGSTRPVASNVNYSAGDVVPNAVLAKIGTDGKVCIYTLVATDIIADVNGYAP